MTLISRKHQSIVVESRPDLAALFPHAIRWEWKGNKLLVLPHGIDETRMLRNLDIDVPSPIAKHYNFKAADGKKPFKKQILTSESMVMHPRSYVLNEMGTGKTRSCLWAFDYLQQAGKAKRMLIVAPLSTLDFTWAKEILMTMPHKTVRILSGSAERRKKLLNQAVDIYIINHDGVKVVYKELQRRMDIDVICFDEAAAYRNRQSERSKIARGLATGRKYVWGMTGSPTPRDPTDAYGLALLITPDVMRGRSYVGFRNDTMIPIDQFRWVPRKDANQTVSKLLSPAVRFTLDDIMELPPVVVHNLEVAMTPMQQRTLKQLKQKASALLATGEQITAANGGVLVSKMLQVSLGWAYGERDREVLVFDNEPRMKALMDIIKGATVDLTDMASHKILIFSPFKSATAGINERLKEEGVDFATVTGDTPPGERMKIFTAFQGTPKYRVLNAHPECMSHGLTLTAADTVVWFGPTMKLEVYEQANARITRVGQKHKQQIVRMMGTTADRAVYARLANRQDMQDNLLGIIAEISKGK